MTIPFWLMLTILLVIGVAGYFAIGSRSGDYDIFTPILALCFLLVFCVLVIGLALGKWVFK